MICVKCGQAAPEGRFCALCGAEQTAPKRQTKKRGNGQGTVFKLPNGSYLADVTLGYWLDDEGKAHRKRRTKTFLRKKDAIAALPLLALDPEREARKKLTLLELYEKWYPTHKAAPSTMGCYRAAMAYFGPLHYVQTADLDVDDLQECIDECPKGRRTKENMRALISLLCKYGIPRKAFPEKLNFGEFLTISGDPAAHRAAFTPEQIETIRAGVDKVPGAAEIYAMILLGFRPSEFLMLTAASVNVDALTLTGGGKTAAGTDRIVTISPKIHTMILSRAAHPGPLFPAPDGSQWQLKAFTENLFYPALEALGIDNPLVEVGGGVLRHKYTPHTCRHTFATLIKKIPGAERDKLELIGHASGEMLRYYQDVGLEDLRAITDQI